MGDPTCPICRGLNLESRWCERCNKRPPQMTDVKLPEPAATIGPCMFGGEPKVAVPVFTADQLTAAVIADRAERTTKVDPVRSRMIPMHYAENIWYAATILEKSESIIDKREAKVLRELAWLLGVQEMA